MQSIHKREYLFDGDQETMVETVITIVVNDTPYHLSIHDFERMWIDNTDGDVVRRLVQVNKIRPIGYSWKGFRSADGVHVYQTVRDGHVIVVAFGEKQPMRFILTLEGIFPTVAPP